MTPFPQFMPEAAWHRDGDGDSPEVALLRLAERIALDRGETILRAVAHGVMLGALEMEAGCVKAAADRLGCHPATIWRAFIRMRDRAASGPPIQGFRSPPHDRRTLRGAQPSGPGVPAQLTGKSIHVEEPAVGVPQSQAPGPASQESI